MLGFKYQRLEEADTAFSIRATLEPGHECAHAPRTITCQLSGRRGVARLEARLVNDQTLTAELVEHQPAGD
jgi:hypothetical protein